MFSRVAKVSKSASGVKAVQQNVTKRGIFFTNNSLYRADSFYKLQDRLSVARLDTNNVAEHDISVTNKNLIDSVAALPDVERTVLPNGVTVVSYPYPGKTATVGAYLNAGSRYDNVRGGGEAHFLEHLMFKGTSNRSKQQLVQEIESLGSTINAYTSRESTVFYGKTLKENVNKTLAILGDMLLNSTVNPAAVDAERSVILREMESVTSDRQEHIFDRLHQTAYRDTILGQTILGTTEAINNISSEDLQVYRKQRFTGNNIVVVAVGEINHAELVEETSKTFGAVKAGDRNQPLPSRFLGSMYLERDDELPTVYSAYAFETAGWNDADNINLSIIQGMLGSYNEKQRVMAENSSSRLTSLFAIEGLVESFSPFNIQYSDTGLFGIHFVCDPCTLDRASYEVATNITQLTYGYSDEEVNEARNNVLTSLLSGLRDTTSVFETVARQVSQHGRYIHPLETLFRLQTVDITAVRDTANRFFYDRDFAQASHGNTFEHNDYNALRTKTWAIRF